MLLYFYFYPTFISMRPPQGSSGRAFAMGVGGRWFNLKPGHTEDFKKGSYGSALALIGVQGCGATLRLTD